MAIAYLGLGSNMGDKKQYLYRAIRALNEAEGVSIAQLSSLYETAPWGYTDQDVFMNLVAMVETSLTARELLAVCQRIELELDRVREVKWGPRTMDIDILLYDNEVIEEVDLKIPHPYMLERDFVVLPLAEIAPDLMVGEKSMKEWAQNFDAEQMTILSQRLEV